MITPAPIQQPIVNKNGLLNQIWVRWFDALRTGVYIVPTYTVAQLPNANAGSIAFVNDEVGGAVLAFSDGTNWRRTTDRAIVS